MVVQRGLFGGADLIREWGRIGMSGQVRIDHHRDEGKAVDALAELAATHGSGDISKHCARNDVRNNQPPRVLPP